MIRRSGVRFMYEAVEGIVLLLLAYASWPLSRGWLRHWGSTPNERSGKRPGDSLVSGAQMTFTRGIAVSAPAEHAWQWVVQIGLDRAGFYSYELLERLAGIPVKNVEQIVPEWQHRAPGDEIRLHPKAPAIPVANVKPPRHVCFGHAAATGSQNTDYAGRSWSIYVDPTSDSSCRLLSRNCIETAPNGWTARLGRAFEEPLDFVMEQRMLRTIRRLCETRSGRAPHVADPKHIPANPNNSLD